MKRCNPRDSLIDRFNCSYLAEPNSGCWLWIGAANKVKNFLRPRINVNGRPKSAYRTAYELFIGEIPEGKIICHKCNVSICVNPNHLYAGTHKSNAEDCVRSGRHCVKGKQHNYAKIPHADVWKILEMIKAGVSKYEIARSYGVTNGAIHGYLKRRGVALGILNLGRVK